MRETKCTFNVLARSISESEADRNETHLDLDEVIRQADLDRAASNAMLARKPSRLIIPTVTSDGATLVDWYTTEGPTNSQNWSINKKCFVTCQICIYTFSVYIGVAIYTLSFSTVTEIFRVLIIAASLGLALYLLRYGTRSLLFFPLSEMPRVS